MESTHITPEQFRELLASGADWTADLRETGAEETADLPDETIAGTLPVDNQKSDEMVSAAVPESSSLSDNRTSSSAPLTIRELPLAPIPKQHAFGFCAFVCIVIALMIMPEQLTTSPQVPAEISLTSEPLVPAAQSSPAGSAAISPDLRGQEKPTEARPSPDTRGSGGGVGPSGPLGVVTFESRALTTSEEAMAAVFIVRRTKVLRGAATVRWAARSGSADAGIDFSDAAGTIRFVDGQEERAIYVPLRNDLLEEEDETFKVCLRSSGQARIDGLACAEVTIRDDDRISGA